MSITLPSAEEASYLRKFGVASVYLVVPPKCEKPTVLIGTAAYLSGSAVKLVKRHESLFRYGKPDFAWAGWCDRDSAARIEFALTRRYGTNALPLSLEAAVAEITAMAARLGTRLADHAHTMARVGNATAKIADRVEASRGNGTLAAFNAAYKQRRHAAMAEGKHIAPYNVMLRRLRAAMATVASGGAVSFDQVFGD
jgi:hypothetical protein